jgi:hypothetical protein
LSPIVAGRQLLHYRLTERIVETVVRAFGDQGIETVSGLNSQLPSVKLIFCDLLPTLTFSS